MSAGGVEFRTPQLAAEKPSHTILSNLKSHTARRRLSISKTIWGKLVAMIAQFPLRPDTGPARCAALILGFSAISLVSACSSRQQPAETATEGTPSATTSETAAPTEQASTEGSAQPPGAGDGAAASEPKEPAANTEPLAQACKKMCDSLSSKCSKDQVKSCHLSYCAKYVTDQAVCDPAARAAFDCAQTQKDFLLCSNVVPESCAKKFMAVDKCSATGVAPEKEKEGNEIPAGWARYDSRDARFTVIMPKGVETKTENGNKVWTATAGSTSYDISLQPAPNETKFDNKSFLRIATKLLGRCADKLKLNALVEKDTHTLIHFRTVCPDKTQQRGVMYVEGKEFFVARARWGEGPNPDTDTFAYSFERKK
jgi:hypothetical protein